MRFEPDKKLHSREHLLADDLSRMLAEPKRFAAYLGIAKLYDESDLRALARRVLEKEDLPPDVRGKYFFAALRGLWKKSGIQFKRRKKKRKKVKNIVEKQKTILKEPHKTLRTHTRPIDTENIANSRIQKLIAAMKETLKNTSDGVGLAAPQVGESLSLFIVSEEAEEIDRSAADIDRVQQRVTSGTVDVALSRLDDAHNVGQLSEAIKHGWKYYVFINPIVKKKSRKKVDGPEGCLSVPGTFGTVARFEKITVTAYDETGKKFTRGASKFFARVIQHELDHLEGILFIDAAKNLVKTAPRIHDASHKN